MIWLTSTNNFGSTIKEPPKDQHYYYVLSQTLHDCMGLTTDFIIITNILCILKLMHAIQSHDNVWIIMHYCYYCIYATVCYYYSILDIVRYSNNIIFQRHNSLFMVGKATSKKGKLENIRVQ